MLNFRCRRFLSIIIAIIVMVTGINISIKHEVSASVYEATVDINTSALQPLNSNFGGYNADFQTMGLMYTDPAAANLMKELKTGVSRYPSGTDSDYFNLRRGDNEDEWVESFFGKASTYFGAQLGSQVIRAKPEKQQLKDWKYLLDNAGSETIIVINGFTDTAETAAAVAKYCKDNNIKVSSYELSNEAFYYTDFFANATDYANKMRSYYDAIKSVDRNAQVNVMFTQGDVPSWDSELGSYPDKYWDGICFHVYRGGERYSTFDAARRDLNTALAERTNSYIDSYYLSKGRPEMPVTVSEFNSTPLSMTNLSTSGIVKTLYNGIFAAEYTTRLSTHPNVKQVLLHALVQFGTNPSNPYKTELADAYEKGETLDTTGYDFGIYKSGAALALQVTYEAVNNSSHTWGTTTAGDAVVTKYSGSMPALYSQAYKGKNGKNYVVITNKSEYTHNTTIRINGSNLTAPLTKTYISSPDPEIKNSVENPNAIEIQTEVSSNPVVIPPYSVVRLEWDETSAKVPAATRITGLVTGSNQVEISWLPVPLATGYKVLYGTVSGTYTGIINAGNTDRYTVSGLNSGTFYYFTVVALNSTGDGPKSPEARTKISLPAAPVLEKAFVNDGTVTLSWRGSEGAIGYKIKYGTEPGNYINVLDVKNTIGYELKGLTNGTTYYFAVSGYNNIGDGANSSQIAAVPKGSLPYSPHSLKATATYTGVNLLWTPSYREVFFENFENGNGLWTAISGSWNIFAYTGGKLGNTKVNNCSTTAGTGISYTGDAGWRDYYVQSNITPKAAVTGQFGLITRYLDQDNYYYAYYDTDLKAYKIAKKFQGTESVLAVSSTITDSYNVLIAEKSYTFRFEASCNNLTLYRDGSKILTVSDNANVLQTGKIGLYTNNQVADFDRVYVKLSNAAGYNIERSSTIDGEYVTIASGITETTYKDVNVHKGLQYFYRVSAINENGKSNFSSNTAWTKALIDMSNIAPLATVTASSTTGTNYAIRAVDGVKNNNNNRWISGTSKPHTLELAWDTDKFISKVKVWSGHATGAGLQIKDYEIQYWDGSTWKMAATVTNNKSDGFFRSYNEIGFSQPVSTSKLRMYITGPCVNTDYSEARVLEIEVFGTDYIDTVPDPTDAYLGNYINFGMYNGKPIKYRIIGAKDVNSDGTKELLLFSDKIITIKSFDAKSDDPGGRGGTARINYGSNYWAESNLRDWLNSEENTVSWTAASPTVANVWQGYNAYSSEKGFMANGNMTSGERNAIIPVTHKNVISSFDESLKTGGTVNHTYIAESVTKAVANYDEAIYSETVDKVFVPSIKELKEYISDKYPESLLGYVTEEALVQSDSAYDPANTSTSWHYWTRDALSNSAAIVRSVANNGTVPDTGNAVVGTRGVRTAVFIRSDLQITGEGTADSPYILQNLPGDVEPDPDEGDGDIVIKGKNEGIYALIRNSDLDNGNAAKVVNLDFVDGITYYSGLSAIIPREGQYSWTRLDEVINMCKTAGKPLKIAILAGRWVPDWIYTKGAEKFSWVLNTDLVDPGKYDATAPVPWDSVYLSVMKEMVSKLSERYADKSIITTVQVTGPSLANGLETNLVLKLEDVMRIGYTEEKLINAWKEMIDAYAEAFPKKNIALCLNNYITEERNAEIPRELREYAYNKIGSRFIPQVAYVTYEDWFKTGNSAADIWAEAADRMKLEGQLIDIYSSKALNPELIYHAISNAASMGCNFIEVFPQDLLQQGYYEMVSLARKDFLIDQQAVRVETGKDTVFLKVNDTIRASALVIGDNGNPISGKKLNWISENPMIASVDSIGNITGVSKGQTVIHAVYDTLPAANILVTVSNGTISEEISFDLNNSDSVIKVNDKLELVLSVARVVYGAQLKVLYNPEVLKIQSGWIQLGSAFTESSVSASVYADINEREGVATITINTLYPVVPTEEEKIELVRIKFKALSICEACDIKLENGSNLEYTGGYIWILDTDQTISVKVQDKHKDKKAEKPIQ